MFKDLKDNLVGELEETEKNAPSSLQCLTYNTPETPLHGHGLSHDQPFSASPTTDDKKLMTTMSGMSHHLTQFAPSMNQQLNVVNITLQSMEEWMAALEAIVNCSPVWRRLRGKDSHTIPKLQEEYIL